MLPPQLVQLLATGLTTGAIYALLGLGLTLTYSTTKVVNVAIGEFAMLGALSAVTLVGLGWPLPAAALAATVVSTAVASGMYLAAIRPSQVRGASPLILLIITIAMHLALKGVGLILWGTRSYTLPAFWQGPPVQVLTAVVTRQSLFVLAATALVMAGTYLFFSRTLLGKALRASAVNPLGTRLMGIPVYRMGLLAFAAGGALSGAAGVLITPDTLATYDMGLMLGLKGFVGAVIGGLYSYPVTVGGCILLGVLEALAAGLLPSGYRDAVSFLVLIVILMARAVAVMRHGILVAEEAMQE